MTFIEKTLKRAKKSGSLLCIGLDPDPKLVPDPFRVNAKGLLEFLEKIIQATEPYAAAYKPNLAYFEALGVMGFQLLENVLRFIPDEIPVIADAKRGDVGHSSKQYAEALFSQFGFDAATVSPYLGHDSIEAFLEYQNKGVFILCLTSNPGSNDFQFPDMYLQVAERVRHWNLHGNAGLVVGATHPEHISSIRRVSGPMPYLIPGIGTQGGELEKTIKASKDGTDFPYFINATRSILYPEGASDSINASREAARDLCKKIQSLHQVI